MEIVLTSAMSIILFVACQLWQKHQVNERSIRIALVLLGVWFLRFFLIVLKIEPLDPPIPILIAYDQTFYLLDGLLVWLYTRSMLEKNPLSGKVWMHFIPFILLIAYSTAAILFFPERVIQNYLEATEVTRSNQPNTRPAVIGYVIFLLSISTYYLVLSVKVARKYNKALLDQYSSIDNLKLSWIISFQRLWIILFLIPIGIYFTNYLYPIIQIELVGGLIFISFVILSLVFSYKLVQQRYKPIQTNVKEQSKAPMTPTASQQDEVRMLEEALSREKYYLDEELSLSELANQLEKKPNELSALIRLSKYDSFYDLINTFRFEAVKSRLLETDEQIIQLAYQNGFRNKSTFNKIFKEKTGLTPKEYRNTHK